MATGNMDMSRRPVFAAVALVSLVLLLATVGACAHAWYLSGQGPRAGWPEPCIAWRTKESASKVRVVEATRRGISIELRQLAWPPKAWPAASVYSPDPDRAVEAPDNGPRRVTIARIAENSLPGFERGPRSS